MASSQYVLTEWFDDHFDAIEWADDTMNKEKEDKEEEKDDKISQDAYLAFDGSLDLSLRHLSAFSWMKANHQPVHTPPPEMA